MLTAAIEIAQYFLMVMIGLLPIINPFSTSALFLSLTANNTVAERNRQALAGCIYAFSILAVFLLAGQAIIAFFGISIPGIRIAGGLIVLSVGYHMIFPKDPELPPEQEREAIRRKDIAFTPLAMPSLSGPGSIALVLSYGSEVPADRVFTGYAVILAGILATVAICYVVLRMASQLMRLLGANGVLALTKIMGFILVAIAVQFIVSGVSEFVAGM